MANLYRSWVCMISAVICMSPRWVWHLCNLSCVYGLIKLISTARYPFKSLWARLWLKLFPNTVDRFLLRITSLSSHVFLRMDFPERSRIMAYTTRETVNRIVRKQLHLNHVVQERPKEEKTYISSNRNMHTYLHIYFIYLYAVKSSVKKLIKSTLHFSSVGEKLASEIPSIKCRARVLPWSN